MIAAGYSHNLVLTEDNIVWAFGANGQGQLGNTQVTAGHSSTPVKVDFFRNEYPTSTTSSKACKSSDRTTLIWV